MPTSRRLTHGRIGQPRAFPAVSRADGAVMGRVPLPGGERAVGAGAGSGAGRGQIDVTNPRRRSTPDGRVGPAVTSAQLASIKWTMADSPAAGKFEQILPNV